MEKMIKAKEAAEFLNIHLETIRRLARQKAIPAFKVGKGWRFSKETLKAWANEQTLSPAVPHVLIIDKDPGVGKLIMRMLGPTGYRVSLSAESVSALDILRQQRIDLVLLDLLMPGKTGPETFKEIHNIDEKVPVIIITEKPDSDLMAQAMAVSPILLVSKPFDKNQLLATISMVLGLG